MSLVEVERDVLLVALRAVNRVVDARQQIPVLSNVLLEIGEGRLSVTATDLGMQVTAEAEAHNAIGMHAITLSAERLLSILCKVPDRALVTIDMQGTHVRIESGESKFSLKTLPAGEFPKMTPASGTAIEATLPQRELKRLLALTQSAMAQRDARSYLNGTLISLREGRITVVATDTYRLALASFALERDEPAAQILLPRKAAIELCQLLPNSDHPARLRVVENQAAFNFGRLEMITAVLDNRFPNYLKLISVECNGRFCVNRLRLHQALQRVAILVNEKFRGVRWILDNERLRIEAANGNQEVAEEGIAVKYTGVPIDLGFNVDYLTDALTSVEADQIECAFAGSTLEMTIPGRTDFKYLITPMRI